MSYFIYGGIGVAVLLLIIFIPKILNSKTKLRSKINSYLKEKNFHAAADTMKKLIALLPDKASGYLELAEIYKKGKLYDDAYNVYNLMLKNKIFSSKISDYNIKEKIAELLLEKGKIVEAFKTCYEIVNKYSNAAKANCLLGRIYGSQGKIEKAISYLKKAVELNDKNIEYHYYLGLAYLDYGDLSNGIIELDKAYKLDNTHLRTQYFLALACRQKGLQEKSQMLFDKLGLKNINKLPDIVTNIGILAQNMPKFDIESMEIKLKNEFGENKGAESSKEEKNTAQNMEELLNAGTEIFHSTVLKIINKMGYLVKKEIRNRLIDPDVELDLIVVSKRDEKQTPYFLQFTRSKSEIGTIPFADFISKIKEANTNNGIFITTSTFAPQNIERAKKEKLNITLIDKNKLSRYI